MKKLFYIALAALSLSACEIAERYNQDIILPPSLEGILQSLNAVYIERTINQMDALQEIQDYLTTGSNPLVHDYGSFYEVDSHGETFRLEKDAKSGVSYWECTDYGGFSKKFVKENGRWTVSPIDEKEADFWMQIQPADQQTGKGGSFQVTGIRPDDSGPYRVKFHSVGSVEYRWLNSNIQDAMRVLNLNGQMHYDICQDDTVLESRELSYTF